MAFVRLLYNEQTLQADGSFLLTDGCQIIVKVVSKRVKRRVIPYGSLWFFFFFKKKVHDTVIAFNREKA